MNIESGRLDYFNTIYLRVRIVGVRNYKATHVYSSSERNKQEADRKYTTGKKPVS